MHPADRSGNKIERYDLDDVKDHGVIDNQTLVVPCRGHIQAIARGDKRSHAAFVGIEMLHELDSLDEKRETKATIGNFFQIFTLPFTLAV